MPDKPNDEPKISPSVMKAALLELVEELDNCKQAIQYVYATFDYHRPALDSLRAALAKAKEALKP